MCGISGIISNTALDLDDRELVKKMNSCLSHRGPDDEGIEIYEHAILGHRRLSIIDLSSNGHQPFVSANGDLSIVFNGEIYNYIELRSELKLLGYSFKTGTDTEVLLTAYLHWGKNCLSRFNGMFAFVIYNKVTREIFMARDRFGVKPLYYRINRGKIFFASEVKALKNIYNEPLTINLQSIFDYLCFNRTDVFDETFITEIKRIPKGHYATLAPGNTFRITQWWNPMTYVNRDNADDEKEVQKKIEEIMKSSVSLRMRSDVPVGACLSGGLDSSIIIGLLFNNNLADNHFKTFTASFPGFEYDEIRYVELLQKRFPFQSFKAFPNAEGSFEEFDKVCYILDEPVPSAAFYSQYKVMELARENGITVMLDGQGGDESFAGYQYFHGFYQTSLLRQFKLFPLFREITKALKRKQSRDAFYTLIFQNVPDFLRAELLFRLFSGSIQKDFYNTYLYTSVIFKEFFNARDLNTSLARHFQYKLEHLLRAEDRNSMAFSIEARLPYLDYRLVEYALTVDEALKIKNGENKLLQKKALGKYTINEILNRKDKVGFDTPGESWMKTDAWTKRTADSLDILKEKLPGVFERSINTQNLTYDRWKINNLAQWIKML